MRSKAAAPCSPSSTITEATCQSLVSSGSAPDPSQHRRHRLLPTTGQEHAHGAGEHQEHAVGVAELAADLGGDRLGPGAGTSSVTERVVRSAPR